MTNGWWKLKMTNWKNNVIWTIVNICVLILVLGIGIKIQKDILDKAINFCDKEYGKGNWHWNLTDTDGYYMGEVYQCIPINKTEWLEQEDETKQR